MKKVCITDVLTLFYRGKNDFSREIKGLSIKSKDAIYSKLKKTWLLFADPDQQIRHAFESDKRHPEKNSYRYQLRRLAKYNPDAVVFTKDGEPVMVNPGYSYTESHHAKWLKHKVEILKESEIEVTGYGVKTVDSITEQKQLDRGTKQRARRTKAREEAVLIDYAEAARLERNRKKRIKYRTDKEYADKLKASSRARYHKNKPVDLTKLPRSEVIYFGNEPVKMKPADWNKMTANEKKTWRYHNVYKDRKNEN